MDLENASRSKKKGWERLKKKKGEGSGGQLEKAGNLQVQSGNA